MRQAILRGWKAIAEALGVTRNTAMAWAKEDGMPVYNRGGRRRAVVWARTVELEEWDRRRQRETGRFKALPAA